MHLTEKEILSLSERMMGHLSVIEKCGVYARHCQDQEIRNLLDRHQTVYRQHYQAMQGMLGHGTAAGNFSATYGPQAGGWTPPISQ